MKSFWIPSWFTLYGLYDQVVFQLQHGEKVRYLPELPAAPPAPPPPPAAPPPPAVPAEQAAAASDTATPAAASAAARRLAVVFRRRPEASPVRLLRNPIRFSSRRSDDASAVGRPSVNSVVAV